MEVKNLATTIFSFIPEAEGRYMVISGMLIVLLVLFMAVFAPVIAPYDPIKASKDILQPPSAKHIMGTDNLGRDIFSRIIFGARVVLVVVFVASLFSMVIGVPLGLISGYFGGKLDRSLSMLMDSMYAFPSLILAIAIAAVLGPSVMNAVIAISVVYVPTYFRMIRGQVLSLKTRLFVEAAKAMGAKDARIMAKYIFPNIIPTLVVVFSLSVADAILTEAGLSFLGFIVSAPTPDWGFELASGRPYLPAGYWWMITFPGLMVMLLSLGFALIGEGLSEVYAPRRER
ncbi:ABC-type dipeptide/oligopeptide/nickel transport systems, permease component [Archaeoglobus sulfaticallidus PM70-1]|uniref:ABC-type dipeptide/oligopeptide/nickel transport systems, permease component n=1 Tax=Archaeoglobus sulfaticallidus PM70-1 TaxID=387631 RepID=N0BEY3_9EURY|nr:ABC transporter permease [Archaeoglobus sulfaticallidus]AGK61563.1 ABC-type dipeptide/oligopeptide/nickel transport systems, permease component [Archaeoglobus sulfaticallidus PM70-1]